MRLKKQNTAHVMGINQTIDRAKKNTLIKEINKKIKTIITELAKLQRDNDEESMVRLSDLTQQRDRLMSRLEELGEEYEGEDDPVKAGENSGKQIVLKNDNGSLTVNLVSEQVSDSSNGEISTKSPLGRELVKRKVGDIFEVQTPGGVMQYQVLQID